MALWAQGVYDVEETMPYLEQLMTSDQPQKRTLAILFASQTAHYKINMPCYYAALSDAAIEPLACAVNLIYQSVTIAENNKYYDHYYPELFNKLEEVYKRVTIKEKTVESFVFSWTKIQFERKTILKAMVSLVVDKKERLETVLGYIEDMDAGTRRLLSGIILPVYTSYNYQQTDRPAEPLTSFQREYALLILKDRSEFEIGWKALFNVALTKEEVNDFPDLLKRKAAGFRNKIISILLKQNDEILFPIVKQLLLTGDPEQRLAGLDMLLQLKKESRFIGETQAWIEDFGNRKNISPKEEILFAQLRDGGNTKDISAANGYGIFDPKKHSPIIEPSIDPSNIYEKLFQKHKYAFSMPLASIKQALDNLYAIYIANKDYEYEVENWDKSKEKVLLGNTIRRKTVFTKFSTPEEEFANFPLAELWKDWYNKSRLQPADLFIISLSSATEKSDFGEKTDKQIPRDNEIFSPVVLEISHYLNPLFTLCSILSTLHPFDSVNEFCLGATSRLFSSLDKDVLQSSESKSFHSHHTGWQGVNALNLFEIGRYPASGCKGSGSVLEIIQLATILRAAPKYRSKHSPDFDLLPCL